MDEMMAAMVLTSLSCSPVVQSPPGAEANFSGEEGSPRGFWVWQSLIIHVLCSEQLIAKVLARQQDSGVPSFLCPRPAE